MQKKLAERWRHATKYVAVRFLRARDARLIEIALDFVLMSADAVSLVPMNFCQPNTTVSQWDSRHAFPFPPPMVIRFTNYRRFPDETCDNESRYSQLSSARGRLSDLIHASSKSCRDSEVCCEA